MIQIYSCQMMPVMPMYAHLAAAIIQDPVCQVQLDQSLQLRPGHPWNNTMVEKKATGTPKSYMNAKRIQRNIKTYILMHSCWTGSYSKRCRQ